MVSRGPHAGADPGTAGRSVAVPLGVGRRCPGGRVLAIRVAVALPALLGVAGFQHSLVMPAW